MYQIFVVEDELLIRQSIRNTIEKMQGPYSCCGEASDGEMALSMMQDLMPDILITDIRMPFLDGFGLTEHAKAMMPWLKVIIISGYGDFESAQKAITLGVDQYLLKPVRPADVIRVVEEMAQQIEKNKAQALMPGGFDNDEVQLALRQHFMHQLLYGGTDTTSLLDQVRTLKLDIIRRYYRLAVCSFDVQNADQGKLRPIVDNVSGKIPALLYYFNAADQLTLLFCANDPETLNEDTYQYINILRHELKDFCPVITTVVSDTVQRLGEICSAHRFAVSLLKKICGISPGKIISMDDTARLTADIVQFNGPFGDEFLQKLQYAGAEEVPSLLDEVLKGPDNEQFGSTLVRYYALVNLLKMAVQIIHRNSPGEDERKITSELSEKYNILTAFEHYDTFRKTAEELLVQALGTRRSGYTGSKYSFVLSRAKKYVADNYFDPNISLISAAKHVGMSTAHFSTVFSQEEGTSFISYLTSVRLAKAKELLSTTSMKLADIALEIGYNEPNYFSHVFRKAEGMTPKEYRNRSADQ